MRSLAALAVAVLLAACAGVETGQPATTSLPPVTDTDWTAETLPEPSQPEQGEGKKVDPALQPLVDQAKQDLAARLSVSVEMIEAVSAEAVVWPDSSLGCPEPGMAYLQVLTDGALVKLRAEGKLFEYHSGGGRDPFLCERA